MNPNNAPTPPSRGVTEERLEACLAGELSAPERDLVESHLAECELSAEEVRAKHALGQLPELLCPSELVDAAEAAAAEQATLTERRGGVWERSAVLVALAASLALVWFTQSSTPRPTEPVITTRLDAEETKLVLAELGETFRSRAETVKQKVYDRSLAKPARQVVFAMTDSKLADWGAKAANLLGDSEPSPPGAI